MMNDQERIKSMLEEIDHDFISYDNLHNDGGHGLEIIGEALRDRLKKLEKREKENTGIGCLGLSVISYNCLKRAGIDTVGELMKLIERERLDMIRGMGLRSHEEILKKIEEFNERTDT